MDGSDLIIGRAEPKTARTVYELFERGFVAYLYDAYPSDTAARYVRNLTAYCLPVLGELAVEEVGRDDTRALYESLPSPQVAGACRSALSCLFRYAVRLGLRASNPAVSARSERIRANTEASVLFLPTFAQIEAVIDLALSAQVKPAAAKAVALGFGCGLTLREMRELRSDGVDILRMRLNLPDGTEIPVAPPVAARLGSLLDPGAELFMSGREGSAYSPSTVRFALDGFCLAHALPPIDYDVMRESLAAALLNEGVPRKRAALFLNTDAKGVAAMARRGERRARVESFGIEG